MTFFFIVIALLAYRLSGANQFAAMRIESNQARGTFQQLRLAVRLTYKLYALYYRIEAVGQRIYGPLHAGLRTGCSVHSNYFTLRSLRSRIQIQGNGTQDK